MSFVTDAALKSYLQATVHKGTLVSHWDTMGPVANSKAYRCIVSALAKRGYTASQIADWDEGEDYQKSIGLYWLLTHGAAIEPDTYSKDFINAFDLRKDLETVAVLIDGDLANPEGTAGQVTTGEFDQTGDYFGKFPPDDVRYEDEVTRF